MRSTTEIIVRYAETDKMGIVHHSNYPIWYEAARTDFTKCLGMTYTEFEKRGVLLPLISMDSKFIKPAFYEDVLNVEVALVKVTPAKLIFEYQVYRKNDQVLINTGHTVHAMLGPDMRPIRMKKEQGDLYQKLLDACEEGEE